MAKKKKKSDVFWRIIVSAVGVALIAMAITNFTLFIFGTETSASVNVRRFLGADNGKPADIRYKWSVDYTFFDEDGDEYEGHSTKLGSELSVKTDNTVYYFEAAPWINALESEVKPNWRQILYLGLGVFLIYVMNPEIKKKKRKKARTAKREKLE